MQVARQLSPVVVPIGVRILAAAAVLLAASRFAYCDDGSLVQRRACKPDVFRLCGEFIPDPAAITSCLQRNRSQLNPDCRAVFDGKLK